MSGAKPHALKWAIIAFAILQLPVIRIIAMPNILGADPALKLVLLFVEVAVGSLVLRYCARRIRESNRPPKR